MIVFINFFHTPHKTGIYVLLLLREEYLYDSHVKFLGFSLLIKHERLCRHEVLLKETQRTTHEINQIPPEMRHYEISEVTKRSSINVNTTTSKL